MSARTPDDDDQPAPAPYDRTPVHLSRRPRMVPFLLSFAVVGLIVGAYLALRGPASGQVSPPQEIILLAVPGALLGGLVGALVYLLVERLGSR